MSVNCEDRYYMSVGSGVGEEWEGGMGEEWEWSGGGMGVEWVVYCEQ